MIPKVGQRWQFVNYRHDYVAEIVQITPSFLVQVVSCVKSKSHFNGEFFTPTRLTAEGSNTEWWSYLEGQDKP